MKLLATLLLIAVAALSQAADPTTAPKPVPSTSANPIPPAPTTSEKPVPSTSEKPAPSTSENPAPSTTEKPAPSTSENPAPSTTEKPAPSTSVKPVPSSPTPIMSSSSSIQSSISKSVAPSISKSVAPSSSMSKSISPSSASPTVPASSKAPTTQPTTPKPTTVKPTPKYAIDAKFSDPKTGKPCVWFEANAHVSYKYMNNNETIVPLTKGFTVQDGECSNFMKANDTSMINLVWPGVSMTVQFKVTDDKSWTFHNIGVAVKIDTTNSGNGSTTLTGEKVFSDSENSQFLHADANRTYSCSSPDIVKLDSKDLKTYNISISFDSIMVQPFSNNGNLSDANDSCSKKTSPSNSSSIVPIAVGCALAGLIVIVLIAYLIGRRKNDGRGYQQV